MESLWFLNLFNIKYMDKYHPHLYEGQFYHIYNRGNNKENIFYKRKNLSYFLSKYDKYLTHFINTYAYCLMPNHFHLLIKVKNEVEIISNIKKYWKSNIDNTNIDLTDVISNQFRSFFVSYAMSINEQEKRSGSLFLKNFKRKQVQNNLERLIFYIHFNPVHHKISDSFENYEWSSYSKILNNHGKKNVYEEILEWFGGKENYVKYHKECLEMNMLEEQEFLK
jgi:putative transposase